MTEVKVSSISRKQKAIETTKRTRNRQVYEQALLIGLLNKYTNLMFRKTRCGDVCDGFLRIDKLSLENGDEIDVSSFLRRRASEIYENDRKEGINEKTAKRRMQKNRRAECIHLYIDILSEFGYKFDIYEPKGKYGSRKLDYIKSMYYQNKRINIDENKLKELNDLLNTKVKNELFGIVTINDRDIQELINVL